MVKKKRKKEKVHGKGNLGKNFEIENSRPFKHHKIL